MRCHQDAYKGWYHSSHHFSSFNNKAYLTSVRETRKVSMDRDGNTRGARWCAGCHDPVPFFSGEFDDPNYDDVNNPTSQAGITCTVCHSITNVNSTRGNADYTIEEPQHYPFATSEHPVLAWINETLVKAKPEMHKRTFLKPAIKDSKFCSTCHKVGLPLRPEPLQGFPPRAEPLRHVPALRSLRPRRPELLLPAGREGSVHRLPHEFHPLGRLRRQGLSRARARDRSTTTSFPPPTPAWPRSATKPDVAEIHAKYLKDKKVRVDLFALREGGGIDGALLGPLRPDVPTLKPGKPYLVEVVVRTLGLGHPVQPGDGRLQRDLGRADRQGRRPGHRPIGRDRPGR